MSYRILLRSLLPLAVLCLGAQQSALASTESIDVSTPSTYSGTFTSDTQVNEYTFSVAAPANYSFYTTSYGGGANLNGTTSLSGGFVPVLSLFNGSGAPVGNAGGSGMCSGSAMADGATGLCNDASLNLALGSGSYTLALSEFPNSAVGNLSDGFLADQVPGLFNVCSTSAPFQESDVAPCAQRNGNYSLNIAQAAPVPEPPTWILVLPLAGVLFLAGRQQLS